MSRGLSILRFLVMGAGTALLILGLLFWTGRALGLVPLHMLLGVVLVVCLWVLAGMGFRSGAPMGVVSIAVVLSLLMPALGMAQGTLLQGSMHWIVEALHLLVGGAAIGIGQALVRRIATVQGGGAR